MWLLPRSILIPSTSRIWNHWSGRWRHSSQGRLQNSTVLRVTTGFLKVFLGAKSFQLTASLIQLQKRNEFQMNASCRILKNILHLIAQLSLSLLCCGPTSSLCSSPVTCERLIWNLSESVIFSPAHPQGAFMEAWFWRWWWNKRFRSSGIAESPCSHG